MLEELKLPKHFDERIYLITKFAQDIHTAFKRHFNSSTINYYFESCKVHRSLVDGNEVCACGTHRIVWVGPSILQLIHKTQKLSIEKNNAPVLYATPLRTKGAVQELRSQYLALLDEDMFGSIRYDEKGHSITYKELCDVEAEINKIEYWIGDVSSNGYMICGDAAFVYLWNKIRNK